MTTVITDGKVIVADTGISDGDMRLPWRVQKIKEFGYRESRLTRICAIAGCYSLFEPLVYWYFEQAYKGWARTLPPPPRIANHCSTLWVFEPILDSCPELGGALFEINTDLPYPIRLKTPSVIGSGKQYAQGALALDHTPQEALEAAMACDAYTFGEMQVVELPSHLQLLPHRPDAARTIIDPRSSSPRSPSRE